MQCHQSRAPVIILEWSRSSCLPTAWSMFHLKVLGPLFCTRTILLLSFSLVARSCPTLFWPRGQGPTRLLCPWDFPGKHTGRLAISFSRGSSWPRDRTCVSCIAGRFLTPGPVRKPARTIFVVQSLSRVWLISHDSSPSPRACSNSCALSRWCHPTISSPIVLFSSCLQSSPASVQAQSFPTLCDPVDCSTPGFPVLHQLLKLVQIHVHRVGDAIQPSHLLSSPFPPAFNLCQHQGLFQWVSSSHQVAKLLEFQPKYCSSANAKECSNYHTIALISHTSKVMLKILQARLQQYVNHELPDVQARFRKGRGTRDQIANIRWIIGKSKRVPEEHIRLLYWLHQSLWLDHNKLWKILKEMGIPDHLTCLLRNLYAGQEATVRTGHGTTDWCQMGKGVRQGCILSPCLFNLYAEYIMWNAGLDEAQAGIKIARRNINNLRYTDDTTLMAESEELKSLLMKVKKLA